MNRFAVFILTHGRPDKQITLHTLKMQGYTGPLFFVLDDEDTTADEYRRLYGEDKIITFSKSDIAARFDTGDVSTADRRTIFYARNACFDIAEKLEYEYFLELDDDYTEFQHRYANGRKLSSIKLRDLDALFSITIDFLESSGADCICYAQGGDLIGGLNGDVFQMKIKRKAMNTFFCRTANRFAFVGRINEDVNTYVSEGMRGRIFLTLTDVVIDQKPTQTNTGGMTDVYIDQGTYVKSFFTCMYAPSCTRIMAMGNKYYRLHHSINWDNAVPKILHQRWCKE